MGSNSQTSWSTRTVILAILAAGGLTLGGWTTFLSGGIFNETTAPTGASGKTYVYMDSTTKKLMANVAAAGATYIVRSPTQTANYLQKATGDGVLANGALTDDGTTLTLTGTAATVLRASPAAADKIGRASCRERVSDYV